MRFVDDAGSMPTRLYPLYDLLEKNFWFREQEYSVDRNLRLPDLLRSFLKQSLDRSGKHFVVATIHHHFSRLRHIWPDGRFIYLRRDARDVARSCKVLGWAGNFWTAVTPWIVAEQEWRRLQTFLPQQQLLELRYEDLVRDPVPQLTQVCELIGTSYDPAIFDYLSSTTYTKPDAAFAEQWRRKLSEKEIQLVEARVGDDLAEIGYPLSGLPRLVLTRMQIAKLQWHDRWECWRTRVKRLGILTYVLEFTTRKLGLTKCNTRIVLKANKPWRQSLQ